MVNATDPMLGRVFGVFASIPISKGQLICQHPDDPGIFCDAASLPERAQWPGLQVVAYDIQDYQRKSTWCRNVLRVGQHFYAVRDIPAGEEIFCSYGPAAWLSAVYGLGVARALLGVTVDADVMGKLLIDPRPCMFLAGALEKALGQLSRPVSEALYMSWPNLEALDTELLKILKGSDEA